MTNHPQQPIELDRHGVARFKKNSIVEYLLDKGPFDMNDLALLPPRVASDEAHRQFAQLIGYSVSGYGDLSYCEAGESTLHWSVHAADEAVGQLQEPKTIAPKGATAPSEGSGDPTPFKTDPAHPARPDVEWEAEMREADAEKAELHTLRAAVAGIAPWLSASLLTRMGDNDGEYSAACEAIFKVDKAARNSALDPTARARVEAIRDELGETKTAGFKTSRRKRGPHGAGIMDGRVT